MTLTIQKLTKEIGAPVEADVSLAQFSTFKLGGPAEFFVRAKTAEIITKAIQTALDNNIPYTILGGGANVLIADAGIKGLVIKTENTDVVVESEIVRAGPPDTLTCPPAASPAGDNRRAPACNVGIAGRRVLRAGAGAPLAQIAVKSVQAGLAGLEFAVAIPGSVGGGVRGNAGCFGTEVKDVLTRVHVLKVVDKKVEEAWLDSKDCQFAYRESRFKREPFIILEAEFKAMPGNKEESIAKMKKFLEQKKATQSVESNSAGCMFKNVPWSDWEKISPDALKREDIDDASQFKVKGIVPSGWIIDQLGLKGYKIGQAMVSEKHGNFLLNMGQSSTDQMIQLISYIKTQVRDRLGIMLQEEVQYLGF